MCPGLRKEKQEVHMQLEALQVQLHEIEKDREQIIKAYQCHLIWTMEKLDEPEGRLCVCLEKATTAIINVQEDFESLRNGNGDTQQLLEYTSLVVFDYAVHTLGTGMS